MKQLSKVLEDVFEAKLEPDFVKRAVYIPAMDFVQYVSVDDVTVSKRIDVFLTLIYNYDQDKLVGFKLKGFRHFFDKYLKKELDLSESDFFPLVRVLEEICTQYGDQLTSDPEKKKAYQEASEIARRDNVKVDNIRQIAA